MHFTAAHKIICYASSGVLLVLLIELTLDSLYYACVGLHYSLMISVQQTWMWTGVQEAPSVGNSQAGDPQKCYLQVGSECVTVVTYQLDFVLIYIKPVFSLNNVSSFLKSVKGLLCYDI